MHFANDGELKPITLYKRNEPVMGAKVFKKETVRTMVEMWRVAPNRVGTFLDSNGTSILH